MPPAWKIKREIKRVGMQVQDLFSWVPAYMVEHDINIGWALASRKGIAKARSRAITHIGTKTIGTKAAIYLIFPSDGVLASHLIALDYLNACGFTPIVISNLPIPDDGLPLLQERAALVAERPNFGYDFGGYEHGIYLLRDHLDRLERLAIFNDSSWFPMDPGVNWFDMAESLDKDLVGAYAHEAVDTRKVASPEDLVWDWQPKNSRFHYCSFALFFRAPVLRSRAFRHFWQTYLATDDKKFTILRGEIGLTRRLKEAGFSHGATYPTADLPEQIAKLDIEIVERLMAERINTPSKFFKQWFHEIERVEPQAYRQLFLGLVASQGPAYSLAAHDLAFRQGQFVKKAPIKWTEGSARATLAMLSRVPGAEPFLAEAQAMHDRAWTQAPDSQTAE